MSSMIDTIEGLYVAFYHRAADQEGLDYWLQQAEESKGDYMYDLAELFAQHPQFDKEYGSLNDESFVKAIYQNILNGVDNNSEAISYWVDRVENVGRDGMVAEFVKAVLEYDGDDAEGIARKEFFMNRVEAAKNFTNTLGEDSNPINLEALDQDSIYKASQAVIESVVDSESLESVLNFIGEHDTMEAWQSAFSLAEEGDVSSFFTQAQAQGEAAQTAGSGAAADAQNAAGSAMSGMGMPMGGSDAAAAGSQYGADAAAAGEAQGEAAQTAGSGAAADAQTSAAGTTSTGTSNDENVDYGNVSNMGNHSGNEEAYSHNNDADTTSSYTEEAQHTTEENNDVSLSGVDDSHTHDSAAFGF